MVNDQIFDIFYLKLILYIYFFKLFPITCQPVIKKNAQDNTINIRNLTFANTLQEVKREKKRK